MLDKIKIFLLKRKAKKYYIMYVNKANEYSCGIKLAEQISSELMGYKTTFNETMDRLAKIDINAPKRRL